MAHSLLFIFIELHKTMISLPTYCHLLQSKEKKPKDNNEPLGFSLSFAIEKKIQPKEDNEPPNLSSSYVGFSWVIENDNESKGLLSSLNFFPWS